MVLTGIELVTNGKDDDGIHVIENFTSKFYNISKGSTLAVFQHTREAGS